jgi:hypothetical protein
MKGGENVEPVTVEVIAATPYGKAAQKLVDGVLSGKISFPFSLPYEAVLKWIKAGLILFKVWDVFIDWLKSLKTVIPGQIDDFVIDELIAYLQAL